MSIRKQSWKSRYPFFPRCEYRTRFEGTSAFDMNDSKYWATYLRSVYSDRLAEIKMKLKLDSKIDEAKSSVTREESELEIDGIECINAVLMDEMFVNEKVSAAKTGVISSPWEIEEYKRIFKTKTEIQTKKTTKIDHSFYLYDELLKYKLNMCQIIVKNFEKSVKNPNIDVYCENDYPCILVQVKKLTEQGDKKTDVQSSLYNIVLAYFVALTNHVALKKGIPIELVIRASFCFNIPSVADTAGSLRISVGLIPKLYAKEVLVESLMKLNNDFGADYFLTTKKIWTESDFKSYDIEKMNLQITKYNIRNDLVGDNSIAKFDRKDTILGILLRKGEKSGESICQLITRNRENIELLSDYVHEELIDKTGDLVRPLQRMLLRLEWRKCEEKVFLKVNECERNSPKRTFPQSWETDDRIRDDDQFWYIMERIESVFYENNIEVLHYAVSHRMLYGLYSLLEQANLEFVRHSTGYQDENESESDSDCEFSIPNDDTSIRTYYSIKIVVATGMRAINLAQYCAIYLTGLKEFDSTKAYYEAREATDVYYKNNTFKKIEHIERGECYQMDIKTIDLNHCSSAGKGITIVDLQQIKNEMFGSKSGTEKQKIKVIVFDYTTATTDKVRMAIELFSPHVEVLLFVSSGLKNEQMGADMNPYGVIRIVAEKRCMLDGVYFAIKTALKKEFVVQQTQAIRRAYKSVGAALSSEGIFHKTGWKYRRSNQRSSFVPENDNNDIETICKLFTLYCSGKYEEELQRLSEYLWDRESVMSWEMDKITFLGSKEVHLIVSTHKFNSFDYIKEIYDENPQLTKIIVEYVCNNDIEPSCNGTFCKILTLYQKLNKKSN